MNPTILFDDSSELSDCVRSIDYVQAIEKWKNESQVWNNDTSLYLDFVCKKIRYEWTKSQCENTETRLVLALGVFGFFGALMSFLTFCRRPFVATDVYLYRTVGVLECVHMAVMTFMHVSSLYDCRSSYVCTFFSAHIYMTLTNLSAEAVEFIVVFLCIERTVACLVPQHFHRIHHIGAYRIAACLAVVTSLPLNLIHSFDMKIDIDSDSSIDHESIDDRSISVDQEQKYRETPSWFASTQFYDRMIDAQLMRFCLVAPLIVVATAGSVVGLWQAIRRKRRLRGESILSRSSTKRLRKKCSTEEGGGTGGKRNSAPNQASTAAVASADRTRKEIKQMIDLCCLQLCLAVPIVINNLLCMAERGAKWNIVIGERRELYEQAFQTMTYQEACTMIRRATVLEYLRLTISITHMMSHGLHFYLYILFSAKFRQTLCDWLACFKKIRPHLTLIRKRLVYIRNGTSSSSTSASRKNTNELVNNEYEPVPTPSETIVTHPTMTTSILGNNCNGMSGKNQEKIAL